MFSYIVNDIWKSSKNIDEFLLFFIDAVTHTLSLRVYNLYGNDIHNDIHMLKCVIDNVYINYKYHHGITIKYIRGKSTRYYNRLCIYSTHEQAKLLYKIKYPWTSIHIPKLFNDGIKNCNYKDKNNIVSMILSIPLLRIWMKLHLLQDYLIKDIIIYSTQIYKSSKDCVIEYKFINIIRYRDMDISE